ncbi:alpha/beta hydrolase [Leuconostocaceae bacterium ESL0958]|nr:alpha/beta hydrolase [Leuconostocaceae bacterium ESL0958]
MTKKSAYLLALTLVLTVVVAIVGKSWMMSAHQNDRAIQRSKIQPVIFVPGSGATTQRFDDLFTTINKENRGQKDHSVLKVQVHRDKSLTYSGHVSTDNRQPFIVVGFDNNTDSYATIQEDGAGLNAAMNDLQKRYHFRNFDAIGHSNGGLIWTEYLENYYDNQHFHVKSLMTLASPFNLSETSSTKQTKMLTNMIDDAKNLPSDLTVYSVAGSEDYTDDGTVSVQSVLSGKYVFQKHVRKYTQTTVSGDNANHSKLPENPEVIELIQEKVLNNQPDRGNRGQQNQPK